ncbi:MAG: HoxN/HupN/NixA family nickel/cobalt transporter [Bradyrhizobium sp.]
MRNNGFDVSLLKGVFTDREGHFGRKVVGLYLILIAFNITAWIWALIAFKGNVVLLGAAILAYTLGLRHAFDPDHIAAIDTTTRKLMQRSAQPTTVGFHFSFGHSLAVFAFVGMIAAWGAWGSGSKEFDLINGTAGIASTLVSAAFLIIMAALNLSIARATYVTFRQVRRGGAYVEEDMDILLNKRGFYARIFSRLFRLVTRSWHMIPIGFLFGLGFDTATEVSLLGIAAVEMDKGMAAWSLLAFPTLFAAGMTLMDTTDSVMMVRAYGWAFRNPVRKLYYNVTITSVSALVALVIAGIEALTLMSEEFGLKGGVWDQATALNEHWGLIGGLVVTLFLACWAMSMLIYRLKGYDRMVLVATPCCGAGSRAIATDNLPFGS